MQAPYSAGNMLLSRWEITCPEPIMYFPHRALRDFPLRCRWTVLSKKMSYTFYTREDLAEEKEDVIAIAEKEGLDAHANSIKVRFEKYDI